MELDELEVDIGWSILWARAEGYRVAAYYPLLDSRDGVLCPLEALAGKAAGERELADRLGLARETVSGFALGVDMDSSLANSDDALVSLGKRIRFEWLS